MSGKGRIGSACGVTGDAPNTRMVRSRNHPVKRFWDKVNRENDASLKCECGKPAIFKKIYKGQRLPVGYCSQHKPERTIA